MYKWTTAVADAMRAAGTTTLDAFILAKAGRTDGDVAAASLDNHRAAAAAALDDPRWKAPQNGKPPRKIGSSLHLFDCINCDKCVPVCPQSANFTFQTPPVELELRDLRVDGGKLVPGDPYPFALGGPKRSTHQLANYADLCNDCGNCDVFCPEDGGPYIEKPRFFSSRAQLEASPGPGLWARRDGDDVLVDARHDGYRLELQVAPDGAALFYDGYVELTFADGAAAPTDARILRTPPPGHVVPVGLYHSLRAIARGVFAEGAVSWVTAPFLDIGE
jgi:putative selenate reductase